MKKLMLSFMSLIVANALFAQWSFNGNHIYNNNAGGVGIGISNPAYALEVNGGVVVYDGVIVNTTQNGGISGWFRGASSGNGNIVVQGGLGTYQAYWITGANGVFKIGGSGGTEPSIGAINIDNAGKVGIGTTTPVHALDVVGSIRASNGAFVGAPASTNANILVQGGAGTYTAFWITGSSGELRIGGSGGSEPSTGAINIDYAGKVGIGTTNVGSFKLAVEGKIGAREVQILNTSPWPDYVFQSDYKLLPLSEVEAYIKQHSHLPNVPSANDVKDGVEIGKMSMILLQKVEELTLYVIDLKKENDDLKEKMEKTQKRNRR
jgi:hypothetical protein